MMQTKLLIIKESRPLTGSLIQTKRVITPLMIVKILYLAQILKYVFTLNEEK